MIAVLCEKREEEVVKFAELLEKYLEQIKLKVVVEDIEQGFSFGSFSIFILTNTVHNTKFWGKFGILALSTCITESSLVGTFPYPPLFFRSLTLPISDLSQIFPPDFNKHVPLLPNYRIPNYSPSTEFPESLNSNFKVNSSTVICSQEDYQVLSISLINEAQYDPGCNLSLIPQNTDFITSELISFQGYPESLIISIPGLPGFEQGQPIRKFFKEHCDLTGLIRKPVLKQLSQYCIERSKKDELEIMTTLKGKEKFSELIEKRFLSVVEIMMEYEILIPPGDLLQVLDKIKPRFYSVASDGTGNLEFIVQSTTKGRHVGCFSRHAWEIHKIPEAQIKGEIKPSVFKLVPGPLLLISNGCGIAPFRGILLHISKFPEAYPNTLLIAGFRSPDHFIYKSEIEHLLSTNSSIHTLTCFSRSGPKTYVQDLISQNEAQVSEILLSGSTFICGGTQMGKSVIDQLKTLNDKSSFDWNLTKTRVKCETWG